MWTRGIDHDLFRPGHAPLPELGSYPGPVLLYVGRVAFEKNQPQFLDAEVTFLGALDEDLNQAIRKSLRMDGLAAAVIGAGYSWERATDQFLAALEHAARPVAPAPQHRRTKAAA